MVPPRLGAASNAPTSAALTLPRPGGGVLVPEQVAYITPIGGDAPLFLVDEPRGVGDKVSVCVPEPIVHTGDMAYKNKKVVVQGLLAGDLCEAR